MIFSFLLRIYRLAALFTWCVVRALYSCFYTSRPGKEGVLNGSVFTGYWAKGITKIINLKVKVNGDPQSVKGGLIVSNHIGYLDIISHSSVFNVRFSPKSTLRSWPLIGGLISMNRPVWIDRTSKQSSKKSLTEFRETMEQGINLLVYPEGTTSSGKNGVLPFKSTPFEAVIAGNFPVRPILTFYRQKPTDPTVAWYTDMDFLPHFWNLLGLRETEVELYILEPVFPGNDDRKKLAGKVHKMMVEKYAQIAKNDDSKEESSHISRITF